jgi:hypothetical protein
MAESIEEKRLLDEENEKLHLHSSFKLKEQPHLYPKRWFILFVFFLMSVASNGQFLAFSSSFFFFFFFCGIGINLTFGPIDKVSNPPSPQGTLSSLLTSPSFLP